MKYKVKFQEFLFEELKSYLFANSPDENGCYLLGEVRDSILCITKIIYPKEDDDIYGCIDYCSPSPSFTSRACTLAKKIIYRFFLFIVIRWKINQVHLVFLILNQIRVSLKIYFQF